MLLTTIKFVLVTSSFPDRGNERISLMIGSLKEYGLFYYYVGLTKGVVFALTNRRSRRNKCQMMH